MVTVLGGCHEASSDQKSGPDALPTAATRIHPDKSRSRPQLIGPPTNARPEASEVVNAIVQ